MRARVWILAVVLVAIFMVAVAACGGDDDDSESASPTTTAATTTTEGGADGAAVFANSCGSCHTLEAAGTSGTTGPNLDDVQPDAETVEEQVRNGGGGMPAFEGQLSDDEIEAVAAYVAESAGS
jgi:mono/diheme cytochrome c family protein